MEIFLFFPFMDVLFRGVTIPFFLEFEPELESQPYKISILESIPVPVIDSSTVQKSIFAGIGIGVVNS